MENIICTYASTSSQMLSYNELFRELDQCPAKDIVCYIDACYSGTAANNMHSKNFVSANEKAWENIMKSNPRYIVYLSSRSSETSSESPLVGSGLMTNGIMKGLRGKADSDGDKNITVVNDKTTNSPTGIFLHVAPYIALIGAAIASSLLFFRRKRVKDMDID